MIRPPTKRAQRPRPPVRGFLRRLAALATVAGVLLACTACLEHVESLRTRVIYNPYSQTFAVRRTLIGVEAEFLGCSDPQECLSAIQRTLELTPESSLTSFALSDRLVQRLVDSGAKDVAMTLHRAGERLDVEVDYTAPVGSPAAADTLVQAEWKGHGRRGHYYLVMDAQDRLNPPRFYGSRKIARSAADGTDWVEQWVLPRWTRRVETILPVGESTPLFQRFPELVAELETRGWLEQPAELGGTGEEPRVAQVLSTSVDTDPAAVTAPPPPATVGKPSPAKAWFYEARVSGGGVTSASAAMALEPLEPDLTLCYVERQRAREDLEGSVFLSALVRPDGSVIGTAVNSSIADPPLMSCLERVLADLQFSAWGRQGSGVSDVVIPVVLRVEKGSPGR